MFGCVCCACVCEGNFSKNQLCYFLICFLVCPQLTEVTCATRFHPPHSNNALGPGFSLCSMKDVFGTPSTFLINNPSYMAFLHSALPALTTVSVLHLDESPV